MRSLNVSGTLKTGDREFAKWNLVELQEVIPVKWGTEAAEDYTYTVLYKGGITVIH